MKEVKIPKEYEKSFLKYLEKYLNELNNPVEEKLSKTRSWKCEDCGYYVFTKGNHKESYWHCSLYSSSCVSGITSRWTPKE